MFLIVGLGNPGNMYMHTRHNLGFICLDKLAEQYRIEIKKEKFDGICGEGMIENEKVILLKPQTYMNLSGESIIQFVNFYKLDLNNIIVIYDDIDIEIGKFKIRKKGSGGTHNGMKSVIANLKSQDFARIRVGAGKPEENMDLATFVLKTLNEEEINTFGKVSDNVADAIKIIISKDIDAAMNKYN